MALPIAAAIGGVLLQITASVVVRVLVALGVGVATYAGVDTTVTWLKTQAVGYLQTLPASYLGILALLKVGVCINIVFSAIVARMTLQGLSSGAFKRWVLR